MTRRPVSLSLANRPSHERSLVGIDTQMQQPLPTEDGPARSAPEAVAAAEWMLQLVVDSSGRILRVESPGEEVLGRPRGELPGHTLDEIVISQTDPCRGGCLSLSSRGHGVVSTPGGERSLVWSVLRLDDCGLPDHFVLSVMDLTALERSRATSDEMFRALAATTAAAMFIHRDNVLLECNAAAEQLTGYSREELLTSRLLGRPASQPAPARTPAERRAAARRDGADAQRDPPGKGGRQLRLGGFHRHRHPPPGRAGRARHRVQHHGTQARPTRASTQ